MPAGEEDIARDFYAGLLGMHEVAKPKELAARGGVWFASGTVRIHLGVDHDFTPAKKAHPALRCRAYRQLLARLRAAGVEVRPDDTRLDDASERAYIDDPFGNRIELIEP